MKFTRREFIRGGVRRSRSASRAPAFLSDLARAQGASRRNLVVLYLDGGNDALSTLAPVHGSVLLQPAARRSPIPPANVLQVGTDSVGQRARPASAPHRTASRSSTTGDLALIQRTGYPNSSRSHFTRHRHLEHRQSRQTPIGIRLARPLSRSRCRRRSIRWPAGCTVREVPRSLIGQQGQRARDSEHHRLRVPEPERHAASRRTYSRHGDDGASRRTCRPTSRTCRSSTARRRPRSRRSIAWRSVGDVHRHR